MTETLEESIAELRAECEYYFEARHAENIDTETSIWRDGYVHGLAWAIMRLRDVERVL